jgi:hypothetical protein
VTYLLTGPRNINVCEIIVSVDLLMKLYCVLSLYCNLYLASNYVAGLPTTDVTALEK